MTTKTKYLVIALLLLVLVTTSVGLSTWNIHYQAIVGDISIKNPSFVEEEEGVYNTHNSPWNDYIYFETALDDAGNIIEDSKPTIQTGYPISLKTEGVDYADIYAYKYDGNQHTPAFFGF